MKACRVSFHDRGGVEHSVPVKAVNRYHAFGLALHALRRCSWSHPDHHGVESMVVQIEEPRDRRRFSVTREAFEKWLASMPAGGDKVREYVLMLLGRMEPSREFKRGNSGR